MAQGAGTRAASPRGRTVPVLRGEPQQCRGTWGRCVFGDAECSAGTARPQGQREGRASLPGQSSALALPRTRGGRASSWVPTPCALTAPDGCSGSRKSSRYLTRLPPAEGGKCGSELCHAAEQSLPPTPPVPSACRHGGAASQDTPVSAGWDGRRMSGDLVPPFCHSGSATAQDEPHAAACVRCGCGTPSLPAWGGRART